MAQSKGTTKKYRLKKRVYTILDVLFSISLVVIPVLVLWLVVDGL